MSVHAASRGRKMNEQHSWSEKSVCILDVQYNTLQYNMFLLKMGEEGVGLDKIDPGKLD